MAQGMNSRDIVIFGSGGLGRGVSDLIHAINKKSQNQKWNLLGYIDDNVENKKINGLNVLGGIEYIRNYDKEVNVIIALGSPQMKKDIFEILEVNSHIHFPNLIHPDIEWSVYNNLGQGNILSKGVALSTNITIGDFNLVHYNCSIGHDVKIGNYNSIFPLTAVSGYVLLGNNIEIGTNSAIIPNMKFGNNSIVGAGSTIIKDVIENTKVAGVPAVEI